MAREERERLGEMPINVGDLDPEAVPKLVEILKRRDALPFLIYGRRVRWAKLRSEELEVLLEELGRKCKEYYAAYQEKEEEFRRIEAERNEAMGIHYDYVQQRGDCEKDFNRTRNQLAYLEETGPDADAITRLRR